MDTQLDNWWGPFRRHPDESIVLTDFDGTLADIVAEPSDARARPGAIEVLCALAEHMALVAVVSGRPLDFLAPQIADPRIELAGLYGLETRVAGQQRTHAAADGWRDVVAGTVRAATALGLQVEPKGLSLTLHFRNDPAHERDVRAFAAAQAAATGLHARTAKKSLELHPPIDVDKGTTVHDLVALAERRVDPRLIRNVCFLGDDVGDLPAYVALMELRTQRGLHVVRAVVGSTELPASLAAVADVVIDGPAGAVATLEALLA